MDKDTPQGRFEVLELFYWINGESGRAPWLFVGHRLSNNWPRLTSPGSKSMASCMDGARL